MRVGDAGDEGAEKRRRRARPRLVEGVSPLESGVLGGGGRVFDNGGLEGGVVGAAN